MHRRRQKYDYPTGHRGPSFGVRWCPTGHGGKKCRDPGGRPSHRGSSGDGGISAVTFSLFRSRLATEPCPTWNKRESNRSPKFVWRRGRRRWWPLGLQSGSESGSGRSASVRCGATSRSNTPLDRHARLTARALAR